MKPIRELRYRICAAVLWVVVPLCSNYYPPGSGWRGIVCMLFACVAAIMIGLFVTNLLAVFKLWWKE